LAKEKPATNEDLLAAIDAFAEVAYNADNSDLLSTDRQLAIERYLGKNIEPAPEGRSQIRDRSVFETIEWIKPSLLRIFCSSDEVAEFDPVGPEDIDKADQESQYINYVITQRNPWHQIVNDWFSDALLLKNGYVYACWDKTIQTETELYENQSDDAFTLMGQDKEVEIFEHTARVDEELAEQQAQQYQMVLQQYQMQVQQMYNQAMQTRQPFQAPPPPQEPPQPMLHDFRIRRVNERGRVKLYALDPAHCKVDINTSDYTLDGCDFFEWDCDKTIGELRAAGHKIEDDVTDDGSDSYENPVDRARDLYNESQHTQESNGYKDPSLRRVKVRHVWVRFDQNGDGIPEMQYVVLVGKTILHRSDCDEIPIASISPIPLAHRHVGMSMADSVADIEDVNTAFTRQAIDNLFYSNNPRLAVSDRVNMSDLLDSRPGSLIRVDGQPPQEIMPVVVPDMFPQAVQALQFFDSRRMNRTGINAYFQGTDANVLNKTASGIAQLTSSAAQRVETIARLFSFGVQRLFLITQGLYTRHGHRQEVVKLRNKWVTVDPSQWRKRHDCRISVGLGTGNKEGTIANLMTQFQSQMAVLPLKVASPQNIYRTLIEVAKASGSTNPQSFYTDPTTLPPEQPQPNPDVMLEQLKQQGAQQLQQMKDQGDAQKLQAQLQFDQWKASMDDATKRWVEQLAAQVELTKVDAQKEMKGAELSTQKEVTGAQLQTQKELEVTKLISGENTKKAELDHDATKTQMVEGNKRQIAHESNESKAKESGEKESLSTNIKEVQAGLGDLLKKIDGRQAKGVTKVRDKDGKMIAARVKRADGSEDEVPIQ
jgi:hypothetical protein